MVKKSEEIPVDLKRALETAILGVLKTKFTETSTNQNKPKLNKKQSKKPSISFLNSQPRVSCKNRKRKKTPK
ncbi:response regulator receiver [Entamoeba histolytica]|uniref:Response regulator receiver n=1 Tax=Entamoeba histolytica TaxID=5759 RepID=A0A175JI17_ENTHI|nr:response regulator receiver [Entamoeba histolytica]